MLESEPWRAGIEILILWVGVYFLYKSFRATRGARIFVAVVMILAVLIALSVVFDLAVIEWILVRSTLGIAFTLVIVFQSELRAALANLGSSRLLSFSKDQKIEFAEELKEAVLQLSHKRIGALIALERDISLKEYAENGVRLDSEFSSELAMTIFFPMTSLHDGGLILSKNRISSAGCVFPLSKNEMEDRTLGLRHRAAIGISEETDAVAIVVSEETGSISLAVNGELERRLKESDFKEKLENIFAPNEKSTISKKEEEIRNTDKALASKDGVVDSSSSDLVPD